MKDTIKKVLPNFIINAQRNLFNAEKQLHKPIITQYQGTESSVLQCYTAYNKYGGYCVPLSSHHRPATQHILAGKVWEQETIQFLLDNYKSGDIIHAGTYFGDFIPALSRKCSPEFQVWAFEPNPENYQCARITIAINNLDNVEIVNAGLGDKKSTMKMLVTDETGKALGGLSRLIESNDRSNNQSIAVDILSIDDTIPADRHISIIQLDVEGFEKQALIGAMQTIHRCKPLLVLENLPQEDWLADNILSLGYNIIGKVNANSILAIS